MDFPSIVSSTSDLVSYPHMMQDGGNFDMIDTHPTSMPPASSNEARRFPRGLTHLAVIAAFILPFTAVPYILARRQISTLRRQLAEINTSVKILEQEMSLSWQEMTIRKDDVQKLRGTLWKVLQEREKERVLVEQKELEGLRFQNEVKIELQDLIKESQNTRSQGVLLRSLGTSLADVAAFMHEMELEMGMLSSRGKDQIGGIDRLRSLAQQMRNIDARSEPQSKKLEESWPASEPLDEIDPY